MKISDNRFHLEISEPAVVGQGESDIWGHYQFPHLTRTTGGNILYEWAMHYDDYRYHGTTSYAVSEDGGLTWREKTDADISLSPHPLGNGKVFSDFVPLPGIHADFIDKYTPDALSPAGKFLMRDQGSMHLRIYRAEKVKEFTPSYTAREADPVTGERSAFDVQVNWPHLPLWVYPDNTLMPPSLPNDSDGCMLQLDDGLYLCKYTVGFDSATGEDVPVSGHYSVYIFRSTDCGRTWDYVSQVSPGRDLFSDAPGYEGLCEPMMTKTADGTVIMLMRSGSFLPCYITRSADNCRSWSTPELFDENGVFPQLLTLECGVTLASYGRAPIWLRATGDAAGIDWQEHIHIPVTADGDESYTGMTSCGYTSMLALDDHTALLAYSDFRLPGPDGTPMKSLLVRRITVVENG
ncbi:MAG: exo-alpha-sialidase [Oscillospiraceae bacterium]|nr:exo-alpha-sialidase [Oscillospiraceae bacterium]